MFSLRTVLLLAAASSAAHGGTFAEKCSALSMCGHALRATCKDDAGLAHETSLDLDTCVGYFSGDVLLCQKHPGTPLSAACQQCALNGTLLLCPCYANFAQNYILNSFGLDTCLGVADGVLFCDAQF